ncbi:hypothetical protein EON68_01440 [archaeon]|nr:MAG: hypothetical protein EON68_01440 [archaeon]
MLVARQLVGRLVGLCSSVQPLPVPDASTPAACLPCFGLAYVRAYSDALHMLQLVTPVSVDVLEQVDVLVAWAGGSDLPPTLLYRASPLGDAFYTTPAMFHAAGGAQAKAGANRKQLKRKRLE